MPAVWQLHWQAEAQFPSHRTPCTAVSRTDDPRLGLALLLSASVLVLESSPRLDFFWELFWMAHAIIFAPLL